MARVVKDKENLPYLNVQSEFEILSEKFEMLCDLMLDKFRDDEEMIQKIMEIRNYPNTDINLTIPHPQLKNSTLGPGLCPSPTQNDEETFVNVETKPIICRLCPKIFVSLKALALHQISHCTVRLNKMKVVVNSFVLSATSTSLALPQPILEGNVMDKNGSSENQTPAIAEAVAPAIQQALSSSSRASPVPKTLCSPPAQCSSQKKTPVTDVLVSVSPIYTSAEQHQVEPAVTKDQTTTPLQKTPQTLSKRGRKPGRPKLSPIFYSRSRSKKTKISQLGLKNQFLLPKLTDSTAPLTMTDLSKTPAATITNSDPKLAKPRGRPRSTKFLLPKVSTSTVPMTALSQTSTSTPLPSAFSETPAATEPQSTVSETRESTGTPSALCQKTESNETPSALTHTPGSTLPLSGFSKTLASVETTISQRPMPLSTDLSEIPVSKSNTPLSTLSQTPAYPTLQPPTTLKVESPQMTSIPQVQIQNQPTSASYAQYVLPNQIRSLLRTRIQTPYQNLPPIATLTPQIPQILYQYQNQNQLESQPITQIIYQSAASAPNMLQNNFSQQASTMFTGNSAPVIASMLPVNYTQIASESCSRQDNFAQDMQDVPNSYSTIAVQVAPNIFSTNSMQPAQNMYMLQGNSMQVETSSRSTMYQSLPLPTNQTRYYVIQPQQQQPQHSQCSQEFK